MRFENTKVYGIEEALVGMRLPMCDGYEIAKKRHESDDSKSLELAKKLIRADDKVGVCQPNSKYLQMIEVWVTVTAPVFWWSEFDTYRHVVKNSTSTMHTIHKRHLTEYDFAFNPITKVCVVNECDLLRYNKLIDEYNDAMADGRVDVAMAKFYDLKCILPSGFEQTRMVHMNYATIRNMYTWRKSHRLTWWSGRYDDILNQSFCGWCKSLPYFNELIGYNEH